MIKIKVIRDSANLIRGFTVKGHAGVSEAGSDIVCAAVSALAYTAAGALLEFTGINGHTEKNGYMKCVVPDDIPKDKEQKAEIILETIILGFKQIEHSYGRYVSVFDKEVLTDD
ncbi:MAG: ribosomal-processing cysteine protease Prp [Clostridiaceae bacterium]|nr:ribosomal-processing cysteine protease Prp [Clostridiaceae bacterium]